MRIALIATSLRLGGAEKQFSYIARSLAGAGIDLQVFYLGAGDHYQTVLTGAGVPLHQIFNHGRPVLMLIQLIRKLAAFKPDIVLASQFGDLIFAGLAGRFCRSLVLGGVRSDGFYELRTSGRRSSLLLKLSHGLVANSHRSRDNLASLGIDARDVAVLPNVIDLADFDQRFSKPFATSVGVGRIPVTAVGSLQSCKRFDRFLDGLALARQREPALFGIIAGQDLGEQAMLERRAKNLGLLPGHLEFLGQIENIPALLARSRILVSCSEYEGFPNVILEAMAARLPVLATPAGDTERIVKDGITGYLLCPDKARDMADRIIELIQNPASARQMGEAGRKLIEQDYNITSLVPRLMSVFSDFAGRHGRGSIPGALQSRSPANSYSTTRVPTNGLPVSVA